MILAELLFLIGFPLLAALVLLVTKSSAARDWIVRIATLLIAAGSIFTAVKYFSGATFFAIPGEWLGYGMLAVEALLGVYLPSLCFEIAVGAITPMIALRGLELGASAGLAGVLAAMLAIGQILGDVPAGALAARVGDRRAMLVTKLGVLQRRVGDVTRYVGAPRAHVLVACEVAHRQHRCVGVGDVGALGPVAAEPGIDQHQSDRTPGVPARRLADARREIAPGGIAAEHDVAAVNVESDCTGRNYRARAGRG